MGLGVEHPLVEADDVGLGEQEVKVLERLGQPEALHAVLEPGRVGRHVGDGAVAHLGARVLDDGLEHAPALFLPRRVARDAVHVPDRLDRLGSVDDKRFG